MAAAIRGRGGGRACGAVTCDPEAIAEAVQRPTMRFFATKSAGQLNLQALHRVRSRLVSQRTAIVNEIRAFLLDRGIAVAQGLHRLWPALPDILATRTDVLAPRLLHNIEDLIGDRRRMDERIHSVSLEIQVLAQEDPACERLMTVPGIGPIISSATVAAIGTGDVFSKGRDFGLAWSRPKSDLHRGSLSSVGSPNAATGTGAPSSSRPPASCCSGRHLGALWPPGLDPGGTASARAGLTFPRSGRTPAARSN